jgi:hypothetical protein
VRGNSFHLCNDEDEAGKRRAIRRIEEHLEALAKVKRGSLSRVGEG